MVYMMLLATIIPQNAQKSKRNSQFVMQNCGKRGVCGGRFPLPAQMIQKAPPDG